MVQREGKRVRLLTRNGHDWSDWYPLIVEAALRHRSTSFVIDGEAVLLGVDGISDFDGLHSRQHNDEVQFYAFYLLVSDGDDVRKLPLSMRKTNLACLLARRVDGIMLNNFEGGEIGSDLFRHAYFSLGYIEKCVSLLVWEMWGHERRLRFMVLEWTGLAAGLLTPAVILVLAIVWQVLESL